MKRITYISTLLFTLTASATLQAASDGFKTTGVPSFSRYQGILNRMPFGAPPPQSAVLENPMDAKSAAEEQRDQQLLARKINMSCVNITPAGVAAVGFTDLSAKPPANYYLLVGDDANGWKVLDANYEEEWAQLEKDGTAIYVKLGQGLMDAPPEKKAAIASSPPKAHSLPDIKKELTANKEKQDELPPPTPEEQFLIHKSAELAGGPPAPGINFTQLSPEESQARQEIIKTAKLERKTTGQISSYTDRLLQKQAERDKQLEEENAARRAELEKIAQEIATETINESIKQAELLKAQEQEEIQLQ